MKYILFLRVLLIYLLGTLIISCSKKVENNAKSNKKDTFSQDVDKLEKLINLDKFKPKKVKFLYKARGTSSSRLSVGPTDYSLEAVLYFDSQTTEEIKDEYSRVEKGFLSKSAKGLNFEWLSSDIRKLINSYEGKVYEPFLFRKASLRNGEMIITNNEIVILRLYTM